MIDIQDTCDLAWAHATRTLAAGSFDTPASMLDQICQAVWEHDERTLTVVPEGYGTLETVASSEGVGSRESAGYGELTTEADSYGEGSAPTIGGASGYGVLETVASSEGFGARDSAGYGTLETIASSYGEGFAPALPGSAAGYGVLETVASSEGMGARESAGYGELVTLVFDAVPPPDQPAVAGIEFVVPRDRLHFTIKDISMAIHIPRRNLAAGATLDMLAADFRPWLDPGETIDSVTIVEVVTTDLVLANKSINAEVLEVDGSRVAAGKAVQCSINATAAVPGRVYTLRVTPTTSAGRIVPFDVELWAQ